MLAFRKFLFSSGCCILKNNSTRLIVFGQKQ